MVIWGLPKGWSFGKMKKIIKHIVLEDGHKCKYFVVETTNFDLGYHIFNHIA
jgi:hypothetical protein